jgi:hypothetical protein
VRKEEIMGIPSIGDTVKVVVVGEIVALEKGFNGKIIAKVFTEDKNLCFITIHQGEKDESVTAK